MHDHIGHIAVHEHFAGLQPGNLVGGHAAVRATNPHVARLLLRLEVGKEAGALGLHSRGPDTVVGK